MLKISGVRLPIGAAMPDFIKKLSRLLSVPAQRITSVQILKQSLDARKKGAPVYVYTFGTTLSDEEAFLAACRLPNVEQYQEQPYHFRFQNVTAKRRPVIVGSGPCGLFCALMLARAGLCPIIIERGADVDQRIQAVELFWKNGILNPDTNVQFGEGGAGTFSDGKLTCGKNDPRIPFILREFVTFGAPESILYAAKPHIGTDYLRPAVKKIREEILRLGGEIRFFTKMTGLVIEGGSLQAITVQKGAAYEIIETDCLVLAVGHSARDTFEMLYQKGLQMIQKPFSVGVRIEHKREWINQIQYKADVSRLPAADYKLAHHLPDGRGVYTFCMCPGGYVVASASQEGQVVTNGMSNYARDAENSNSAVLVSVTPEDFPDAHPLSGIRLQQELEQKAYQLGGENYHAPCQLAGDFLEQTASAGSRKVNPSYAPGVAYTNLSDCLPPFVADALRGGLLAFDRKMPGFLHPDAVLTGVESRSSSPVRILRDETMQSNIKNIYPCGEGAGYAGGIMSCAADGIKCAEAILMKIEKS